MASTRRNAHTLERYTFLHRINTSGVQIRPVLKKSLYLFDKVENCKVDIGKMWFAKILRAVN